VYTASHTRSFLGALNNYLLKTSRSGYQYHTLISFWASIASEAVAAMLDHARSARRESQKQNQEDVIMFLMPIINEGLSFEGMADLRVACYMILTILASKTDLDDGIITAMMEAVVVGWVQTSHAGLICLSVLAKQKQDAALPNKVFKAIIAIENLNDDLKTLQKQYRVDRLVLGVILGTLTGLNKAQNPTSMRLVRTLMEGGLMDEASFTHAMRSMISTAQSPKLATNSTFDAQGSLQDLIIRLAESKTTGSLIQGTIEGFGLDAGSMDLRLRDIISSNEDSPHEEIEDVIMNDPAEQHLKDDFDALISRIPTRTAYEMSFLSHSDSYVFGSLAHAFSSVSTTRANVAKFSDLPVLRKLLAMNEPLFISFYIRIWCGNGPANARAAALETISAYVEENSLTADVQILLPYSIYALADPSTKVRRAATELVLSLARAYRKVTDPLLKAGLPILGQESIYGQRKETKELAWLPLDDCFRFIDNALVPGLEECLLDQGHISQLLHDSLNGSKHSKGLNASHKELRTSLRLSIFSFLCSHVVNMPLYGAKSRLLHMLNQITKVGCNSRTKLLLPVLSNFSSQSEDEYRRLCQTEELEPSQLMDQIACVVTPGDREGIQCLRSVIESNAGSSITSLQSAALRRLKSIWPSMKPDAQTTCANALFGKALNGSHADGRGHQQIEVIETLRSLPLSTAILQSFIEDLPSISSSLQVKPPASKRRRTSHGWSTDTALDPRGLSLAIKHITLVLEIVEDAKAERHPELLTGLFQVMSQLQQPQSQSNATTDYLLALTIDSMLAIVKRAVTSTGIQIDHSAVRTDVLIDCVRTTASPQVRNSALQLVATLATVTPELVLHSVMPIFTFMGANVLRQDDDFTVYVVNQTMESIIPRLIRSLQKRKNGPFVGTCELLLSFAAAFEHIPTRRRFPLFSLLVDKVGPSDYLFALLVILVDKYPNDRGVLQFAADLTNAYDVHVRLQTVTRFLDVIFDAQKSKPSLSASLLIISKDRSVESATMGLLQLPSEVLKDQVLISKFQRKLAKGGEDAAIVRSSYAQMLEKIFDLSEKFRGNEELVALCMQILDASMGLPPMSDLVDTFQSLLSRTKDIVSRQVLWSFDHRLSETKADQTSTQASCLAFLPQLSSIITASPDISLRHIAVGSVDRITERFGKKDVPAVIGCARIMSSDACLGASETSLRVVSLLCLATMVEVLGENFISIAPNASSKAVDNLALSMQGDSYDASLHNAVYTFLSALLLYVPWVIAGADLERVLRMSYKSADAAMGAKCDQSRTGAMQLVPKQVEAKSCFSALKRTWPNAMAEGPLVSSYTFTSSLRN